MANKLFYEHNGIKIYNLYDGYEISKYYFSPRQKGLLMDNDTIDIRKYTFISEPNEQEAKDALRKMIDEGYL